MYIRFTVVLFLLLSAPAQAGVEWTSDVAAAFATARAEDRAVLLHVRSRCRGQCNAEYDKILASLGADPLVAHVIPAVVLLRVEEDHVRGVAADLLRKHKPPFVTLIDGAGQPLKTARGTPITHRKSGKSVTFNGVGQLSQQWLIETLQDAYDARAVLARSVKQRLGGNVASADYLLGHVLLRFRMPVQAAERLDVAVKGFRTAGDEAMAQYATIDAAFAWYAGNQKARGRAMISEIMEKPVNVTVEANGWYMRGAMERMIKADRLAINHFRKAYQLAPLGSDVFNMANEALKELDPSPLPPKEGLVAQTLVRLTPPARRTVTGHADFAAEVTGKASRVEFYLDGTRVATDKTAPYRTKIDVGPTPRARTVKAVAFDAQGRAMGESLATVNDREDAFRVNITSPVGPEVMGTATVETNVVVPPGRKLDRVELYWKDDRIATIAALPVRHAVRMNGQFGYLRAVAILDDGSTSEETKLYNVEGSTELMDVSAVTFIATVLDNRGEPVPGLTSKDFTVQDEGKRTDVSVREGVEEPVTIGIAIDSSSSMSAYAPHLGETAARLVEATVRPQDVAFVAAFDSSARIIRPRSNDVAAMRAAIFELRNLGGTSIYDGVTFALQQFQEVSGKRVLVVLSDGAEGTSTGDADAAVRLAKTVGVPIYALIPHGGQKFFNPLAKLAELTGGESFFLNQDEDVDIALKRIAAEIRGQYLLSFQAPAAPSGTWRELKVKTGKGKVRTITGYFAK
ncbi:MAG TPA: VWA domain-containing protein [Thermoanaerobaculia bacterium]